MRPSSRGGRNDAAVVKPVSTAPQTPAVAPAPAPKPPPPAEPSFAEKVVATANKYVGARYVFGGASPAVGFDCSGFVQWVMGQLGVGMGRVVSQQFHQGTPVDRGSLQPGDVVFFSNTYTAGLSHVGVYVGDGWFVDAGTERTGVRRARLADPYWAARYSGARRLG